ncbi:hypothetical protein [Parabacteroides sp. PFB2-10]|uniref:LVIVD repeat-containing protein n=1 Tax=Parabacteroides sp. PFB2-10 TaxID=1742405 RepID=UPI002475383D|nr:hypothetical protein [Parabacteroides sp. PFB2-10]MDL2245201.1 hypothetical protein [Parabacteroides sp. OttesenSCG-928-J18]
MKRISFFAFVTLASLLSSCSDMVKERVEYMINEPVFMSMAEFRSSVKVTTRSEAIEAHGKMCFYNGYLYISEPEKGIHIIDNTNPAKPQSVGFIELLGNMDIAVRNEKLYADSYIDLVWFDLATPSKPEYIGRLEGVFPDALPVIDNEFGYDYSLCNPSTTGNTQIVVGWKLTQRSEEVQYYRYNNNMPMMDSSGAYYASSGDGMTNGVNGSMSRFGLYEDYLYAVIENYMAIFDLSGDQPKKAVESIPVDWNVETIFPYKDCLFLGTPTGMSIYSVADPLKPERMSTVSHVFGCDPVVVENDLAYVTIHSDNWCGQNNNELMIIDVSDVRSPRHIVTYNMKKPKGLGIDNGTLFLCDDGLQVFKVGDPQQLMANRLVHYAGMEGYDVIPFDNILMMIADDGLYQYDYSSLDKITKLSKIAFK